MRILTFGIVLLSFVCSSLVFAKKTKAKQHSSKVKKKKKRRYYRRTRSRKIPPITREAATEIQHWLSPLSRSQNPRAGMTAIVEIIRIWLASRWGLRLKRKAWKQWLEARRAIRLWSPAPFYRKMRNKWFKTRLFATLTKFKFLFVIPKNPKRLPKGQGRAVMGVKVTRLRRMSFQKHRPYRFSLKSFADIPPIHVVRLDRLLKTLISRLSSPSLNVVLPPKQLPLFSAVKGKHSRKVANWITSRFPQTAHLLDKYLVVKSMLEPMGHGYYRMDIRAHWRLSALRADYPRLYKAMLKRNKNKGYVEVVFFDKKKRRRFLKWSYSRQTMEHRFQAVLARGGLMLCNRQWRPIKGPWRPTEMGSEWHTHTKFWLRSSRFRVSVSKAWFKWKVRKTKKGATLTIEMSRRPLFKVKGGEFLRLLAKVFISGGVEQLANRFLQNLAKGDRGRGFRLQWELEEFTSRSRVHFRIIFPMTPDRTLTSLLRILPSLSRRTRRRTKRKKPQRRSRKKVRRRSKKRRRKRRRFRRLWRRLYSSIFQDIESARNLLAQK